MTLLNDFVYSKYYVVLPITFTVIFFYCVYKIVQLIIAEKRKGGENYDKKK